MIQKAYNQFRIIIKQYIAVAICKLIYEYKSQ
jgi:hypothetical protein